MLAFIGTLRLGCVINFSWPLRCLLGVGAFLSAPARMWRKAASSRHLSAKSRTCSSRNSATRLNLDVLKFPFSQKLPCIAPHWCALR